MEQLIDTLKAQTNRQTVKKRSVVLYQGEIPRYVYIVLKGVIKSYSLTTGGEEQVIKLYAKNSLFSVPWIFGKSNHALYYYEAQTDCVLACIEKTVFLEALKNNPDLQQEMLDYFATVYTGSMVHITALEQARAREKVLTILYYLCLTNGSEFKTGKYRVELHLTHSIIASLCGITRETTALELSKLKKDGVVRYTARYYLIDKEAIEKLLGEDNFANLKLN